MNENRKKFTSCNRADFRLIWSCKTYNLYVWYWRRYKNSIIQSLTSLLGHMTGNRKIWLLFSINILQSFKSKGLIMKALQQFNVLKFEHIPGSRPKMRKRTDIQQSSSRPSCIIPWSFEYVGLLMTTIQCSQLSPHFWVTWPEIRKSETEWLYGRMSSINSQSFRSIGPKLAPNGRSFRRWNKSKSGSVTTVMTGRQRFDERLFPVFSHIVIHYLIF